MRLARISIGILSATILGCATGTNGVVPAGDGVYMVGGLGGFFDYSASQAKVRYLEQATKFCADRGQTMVLVNSTGKDSGFGTYASGEVQFRCVTKDVR